MNKLLRRAVTAIYLLAIVSIFQGCASTGVASGSIKKDDAEKIRNTNTAYVFYHNANSVASDGSYQYQTEGRNFIRNYLKKKGYNVEFVGKYRQGTLFLEIVQNDGTQEYTYRTERVVGTYKDKNGNVVGTYNEPTTRSRYKSWTRIDLYVYDPNSSTEAKSICHKSIIKNGSSYDIRYSLALAAALRVIPTRKK